MFEKLTRSRYMTENVTDELIRLENLVKIYDTGAIRVMGLKKINLTIHRGEFVAIMGHSGSGKSTLMNILGCLDRPTLGHYYLDGIDTAALSPDELSAVRNKKIGFVFQSFNLISRTSALKNVELPMTYARIPKRKRTERAMELLECVGLIAKHGLKADPNDKPEAKATGKAPELDNTKMIMMFAMCLLLAALGMPIYCLLDNIPMIEMPKFIGCLFAGAIARNVMEAADIKFYVPEVDAIEHMFLELYLALVLMTTDFTKLAPVAGQMGIILLAQAIFIALFGIFVSFNLFGRDYGAAVMTAGNIGWGCGSGPNAVANEKAVMDQYGWHNIAWVLYPSFAVIIDDIYNPIFLSIFGGLFKG